MFNKKEILHILIVILVLAFAITFIRRMEDFIYVFSSVFVIVFANVAAKKIMSYHLDSEVEVKIWEVERFGFKPKSHFKKPVPMGVVFPLISTGLSFGYFAWMGSLVFDVKAKIHRAAKRHGLYSFSEMTEYHIGLIAASGIILNLFLSIVGYLIGFVEFAQLNIFYAFFNMIPLSDLDGNKIFFGSMILWSFLASLVLVGLGYVFLVI